MVFLRLVTIMGIFARYDALFLLESLNISPILNRFVRFIPKKKYVHHPVTGDRVLRKDLNPAERFASALVHLGPTFIKLGQMLSLRSDIVGKDVAKQLLYLQDALPSFSWEKASSIIQSELGQAPEDLYDFIDPTPVAAASIAQVHKAVTFEGHVVAVKILRPNLRRNVKKDMALLLWFARMIEVAKPEFRHFRPVEVAKTFEKSMVAEMNLLLEAAAADELGNNFKDDPDYRVPYVLWDLTAERVLTLEWIDGVAIGNTKGLEDAGFDLKKILRRSSRSFFKQVYRDGFFHADMHGGNAFITPDGKIVPIDFGIMGRINIEERFFLAKVLKAILDSDYLSVAKSYRDAGLLSRHVDLHEFSQHIRSVVAPIAGKKAHEISLGKIFEQVLNVAIQFKVAPPIHFILLQKTMLMAEGMGQILDPDVNIWDLSKPLIEDWMRAHYGPKHIAQQSIKWIPEFYHKLDETLDIVIKEHHQTKPKAGATSLYFNGKIFYFAIGAAVASLLMWLC